MTEPDSQRPVFDQRGQEVKNQTNVAGDYLAGDEAYNVTGLTNPYLGLRSFTYNDRERFAGRQHTIDEALRLLTSPGAERVLLFVVGASGSGKSSLVQAGIIPALVQHYAENDESIPPIVMRPGKFPLAALAQALHRLHIPCNGPFAAAGAHAAGSENTPAVEADDRGVALLVIDQGEELFTQSQPDEAGDLLDILKNLPGFSQLRMHIIVTLRVDYLPSLFERLELYEEAKRGVELRVMTVDELKDAILRPMQSAAASNPAAIGLHKRFEPELLDALASDAHQDAAYPPLLQVTLEDLWRRGTLKRAAYSGLDDAIGRRAEDVLAQSQNVDGKRVPRTQAEQDDVMQIFTDLVEVSLDDVASRDVRRRRTLAEMTNGKAGRRKLIDELASARLLSTGLEMVPDSGSEVETIDIIHESLINNWERLRSKIAEERDLLKKRTRFTQALREWRANECGEKYLLPDNMRLAEARDLESRHDVELADPDAQEFLRQSVSAVERRLQRERNTLLGFVVVLLTLTIVSVIVAGYALDRRRAAEAAQGELQASVDRIVAENLAGQSQLLIRADRNPGDLALILASNSVLRTPTLNSVEALRLALNSPHWRQAFPSAGRYHQGRVEDVAFSSDDQWIVSGGSDGTIRLWRASDLEPQMLLFGHEGPVRSVDFGPDGSRIVSVGEDNTVRLWDTASGAEVMLLTNPGVGTSFSAAYNPDGERVVVGGTDTVRIWNVESGKQEMTFAAGGISVAFSPSGRQIAAGDAAGTVRVWDVATGREAMHFTGPTGIVWSIGFSPDGNTIVTGNSDGTARIWDAAARQELKILRNHSEAVMSVMFSSDGKSIVTASADNVVRIWEAVSGQETAQLDGSGCFQVLAPNRCGVISAELNADGTKIVIGSADGLVRIWDVAKDRVLDRYDGHDGRIVSVNFQPDGEQFVSTGADGIIRVWDVPSGELVRELAVPGLWASYFAHGTQIVAGGFDGRIHFWDVGSGDAVREIEGYACTGALQCVVSMVAPSPDESQIAVASGDGIVHIRDAANGAEVRQLKGHECNSELRCISTLTYSPNGEEIASGGFDGFVRLWDVASGEQVAQFEQSDCEPGFFCAVTALSFSPDGLQIASSGGQDGTVRIWDVAVGKEKAQLSTGNHAIINSVGFHPDGTQVVAGGDDGSVRIWDVNRGELVWEFRDDSGIRSVAFSPDGRKIISGRDDGTVHLWDVNIGEQVELLGSHEGAVESVAFSPDGLWIVSGGLDGTVRRWDAASGMFGVLFRGHTWAFESIDFDHDGVQAVMGGYDGRLRIWDMNRDELVWEFREDSRIGSVAFSPDRREVVSGSDNGTVRLWDVTSGEQVALLGSHEGAVESVAFSANGLWIVSGGVDHTVRIWDVASGREKAQFPLDDFGMRITSVGIHPDGTQVVAGGNDGRLRIWDVNSGELVWELTGHLCLLFPTCPVRSVAFSPDGRQIVSGGDDGMVRLWDVTVGEQIALRGSHEGAIESVAFSPDGLWIVSGGVDGTVRLWGSPKLMLLQSFSRILRPAPILTAAERQRFGIVSSANLPALQLVKGVVKQAQILYLVEQGRMLARAGSLGAAADVFRRALTLDPELAIAPQKDARRIYAQDLARQAYELAQDGDAVEAVAKNEAALALDLELGTRWAGNAEKLTAQALVDHGWNLAQQGDFVDAVASFAQAVELDLSLLAKVPEYVQISCALRPVGTLPHLVRTLCAQVDPEIRVIAVGSSTAGKITEGSVDFWSLDVSASSTLTVDLVGDMSDLIPHLFLYASDGTLISQGSGSTEFGARIESFLLDEGAYLIGAAGEWDSSGAYELAVEVAAGAVNP